MHSERPTISDELLSAWLDGELPAQQQAQVQAWLDEHPQDRARVQAWADDRRALASLFQPVLDEPLPPALQAMAAAPARAARPAGWALAAGAAGLLLAGALMGGAGAWHWQQQRVLALQERAQGQAGAGSAQGWVQRAAYAHQVYVAEPRHAVEVKAQEEHLARWLTRRIDIPVKLFDLQAQGFALVGGRLLPDGPGKSAQLLYEDAAKRRVTVYLRKPDPGADLSFRYQAQGGLGMFYWIEGGAGYALVGELPKPLLLALAQSIYQQHPELQQGAPGALGAAPASAAPAADPASAPRPAADAGPRS